MDDIQTILEEISENVDGIIETGIYEISGTPVVKKSSYLNLSDLTIINDFAQIFRFTQKTGSIYSLGELHESFWRFDDIFILARKINENYFIISGIERNGSVRTLKAYMDELRKQFMGFLAVAQ